VKVTKLPSLVAIALLILPTVTLNAGTLPGAETRPDVSAPQPVTTMCWVNIGGRWYYIPCN
jgi:hypothetical protein